MAIRFDLSSLRSITSILRFVEIGLAIIVCICAGSVSPSEAKHSGHAFIIFTGVTALLFSLLFQLLVLFNITSTITLVPWNLIELVYDAIWALFFLVSGSICIAGAKYLQKYTDVEGAKAGYGAGAFFAWAAMIVFIVHCYILVRLFLHDRAEAQSRHAATSAGATHAEPPTQPDPQPPQY